MSLRDSLRSVQNKSLKRPAPPDAAVKSSTPSPTPAHPAKRPLPKIIGYEPVLARCQHVERLPLFEPKADKFLAARRQKAQGRDCSSCRRARHEAQLKAAAELKATKRLQCLPQRLPDKSSFFVRYDATTESWNGELITTIGNEPVTITGQKSGVFGLLRLLDREYRSLARRATAPGNPQEAAG
jgi:hypothetical protein